VRDEKSMKNIIRDVKRMYEDVSKIQPLPPPFFEEDSDNTKNKYTINNKNKKERKLSYGHGHNFNDGNKFDPSAYDIRRIEFESPERLREALRLVSEDLDIGVPQHEIGPDGRTLIFHYWKASKNMKNRIEKAIKFFKENKLSLDQSINKY